MQHAAILLTMNPELGKGLDPAFIAEVMKHKRKVKACLNCSQEHTHNNAYCSPSCCKEYRALPKEYRLKNKVGE